jgi:hypothetical protein
VLSVPIQQDLEKDGHPKLLKSLWLNVVEPPAMAARRLSSWVAQNGVQLLPPGAAIGLNDAALQLAVGVLEDGGALRIGDISSMICTSSFPITLLFLALLSFILASANCASA